MVSEPHTQSYSDSVGVRFDGQNYAFWAYSFQTFVKGKGLLSYLDGSKPYPTAPISVTPEIAVWEMNDARVLSYILGSVDSSIALSLRAFPTSAAVWKHLETTYSHVSVSRLFDLEFTLANLSQGELDVNRYYLAANTLWTEIDMLSSSMLSMAAAQEIQSERRRARYFQFLMRLRPEFEQVRSQLLSQNTTDISTIVAELVRAETRFQTQTKLDNLSGSANMGSAFAAGKYRPRFSSNQHQQSFIGSSSNSSSVGSGKNMGDIRCHHCQELGHYVSHCLKRNICTYCKKPGHLILECRLRTKNNARSGRGNAGSGYSVTDSASGPSSISDVGSIAPPAESPSVAEVSVQERTPSSPLYIVHVAVARHWPRNVGSARAEGAKESYGLRK
ncbi:Retrovirus-related Pol polyprotein from transposon RE1 [Linum perenne]